MQFCRLLKWLMPLGVAMIAQAGWAQQPANGYSYPELLVTPRASETLLREAKEEDSNSWTLHTSIQASSLLTLLAGVQLMGDKVDDDTMGAAEKSEKEDAAAAYGQIGAAIGGGWLAATVGMSAMHRPYRGCQQKIGKMPTGNQHETLVRERLAEECLVGAGQMARRMAWLSALSNFTAGILMTSEAIGDLSQGLAFTSALGAFIPLIFDHRWERTMQNHNNYKKRIYGPLSFQPAFLFDKNTKHLVPGWQLALNF